MKLTKSEAQTWQQIVKEGYENHFKMFAIVCLIYFIFFGYEVYTSFSSFSPFDILKGITVVIVGVFIAYILAVAHIIAWDLFERHNSVEQFLKRYYEKDGV